jgi:Arc/MetJ-type ribon-helix-helix transcriptional regulator
MLNRVSYWRGGSGCSGRIVAARYDERMSKVRLSASVDAELVAAAEAAVAKGRLENVSQWVNEALRSKAEQDVRLEALGAFIAEYEAEHGEITPQEMRSAVRRARARAISTHDARARRRKRSARR